MGEQRVYSIFGAGAAGLYTAWRLLEGKPIHGKASKQPRAGDVLELYDWGRYNFTAKDKHARSAGARICTWFYNNNHENSYLELGGMRYSYWNRKEKDTPTSTVPGHRLVTTVIEQLGLDVHAVPFNVTNDQLFYLRNRNFYLNDISSHTPAPYDVIGFLADTTPDQGFATVEKLAVPSKAQTRAWWCDFYNTGTITKAVPDYSVFQQGDPVRNIGYWNFLYDQLGSEGYDYAADGNGYSSNVINTHSGVSISMNDEFAPGSQYRTLSIGYSGMFNALFDRVEQLAKQRGVEFRYHPDTRLHSIVWKDGKAAFTHATRANPDIASGRGEADFAWLAMPRAAVELVAEATRFHAHPGAHDILNTDKVTLYLEAAIMQPSYKVGMFFEQEWWTQGPYPALIEAYVSTPAVVATLRAAGFPAAALDVLVQVDYQSFASLDAMVQAIEAVTKTPLTITQRDELRQTARCNTIGPSVTNSPVRMVVYFGNNARDQKQKPVYGILASYDDEDNADFWRELELGLEQERTVPVSRDTQPLDGPRTVPARMVKMLRKMLAELHFGPNSTYESVPEPLQSAYIDWSLPPFNAGYHEWAPHYDVGDVQRKIRKPSLLVPGVDAQIFIVGEAYSNDQAWVEGAYCTAESVLNDFFDIEPIIDNKPYPFICPERP
ncbi:MAG TPA: hypothetical protein VGM88_25910 [Kofleriaceae bacterium]|jgi:hypothetical protein